MKTLMKKAVALAIAFTLGISMIPVANAQAAVKKATSNTIKIVLDAGHDTTHKGASGFGLTEELINLKITQACKAELEKYDGVEVYMTRDGESCPNPLTDSGATGSSGTDNLARVVYASSVGADVYIAFHNNISDNTSANGAEVYYPNSSYNTEVYEEGKGLAKSILTQLGAVGLKQRGIKTRNSSTGSTYEDGSVADYYLVIKQSKKYGFPGLIIEHAFMSNENDVTNFLSTDAQLTMLGVADAQGIASYYGLQLKGSSTTDNSSSENNKDNSSDSNSSSNNSSSNNSSNSNSSSNNSSGNNTSSGELEYSKAKISTKVYSTASTGTKIQVSCSKIYNAENVKFKVTSTKDQTDKKTFTAKLSAKGNWYYRIPMSKFTTSGTYDVVCYVMTNGSMEAVAESSFTVTDDKSGTLTAGNIQNVRGQATLSLSGIKTTFGVQQVKIGVWAKGNKSKKKWYIVKTADSSGKYSAVFNMADLGAGYGEYEACAYVFTKAGGKANVSQTSFTISEPVPKATVTANSYYSEFTYTGSGFAGTGSTISAIKIKVWSLENGKDDIKTYTCTLNDDDTWTYKIKLADHGDVGTYRVYTYAVYNDGTKTTRIKANTFEVPLTKIMGKSEKTAQEMADYYYKYSKIAYPEYYQTTDAPTILDMAQIYLEEGEAEGVRGDVAFAQAMKETGYLKFGGQVKISQFNFAGLGATDDGAKGASFDSVRMGVRAQIQHLKAYASNENLVNECVDSRFKYVTRGSAQYVQWLGIKNNPYGKGWASDSNYGYSIIKDYLNRI